MLFSKMIKSVAKLSVITGMTAVLAGCTNPATNSVFSSIKKEVLLEEASINGYINSIVRYTDSDGKEFLYLQNGRIYYKQVSKDSDISDLSNNNTSKAWTYDTKAPEKLSYSNENNLYSGWNIYKLASDDKYIYALGYQPTYNEKYSRNVPTEIKLFYCDGVGNEWKEVESVNAAIKDYINHLDSDMFMMDASIHLFCTNAPQKAHRKAYIRIGGGTPSTSSSTSEEQKAPNYEENYGNRSYGNYGILKLDGGETSTDTANTISAGTNEATFKTLSAYWFNGDIYFMENVAVNTNETKSADANWVYYGSGKTLISFTKDAFTTAGNKIPETTSSTSSNGASGKIIAIAVTKDSILLGTEEYGAYRLKRESDGTPAADTTSFSTNGDSVMVSPYIIRMIFCTDPSIGEEDTGSALYSSMQFRYTQSYASADYDNVGLWSYYAWRNNWNRE